MRRMWREIKTHRVAALLFLAGWLVAFGLHVFGWRKPDDRPDVIQPVIAFHLLLPVLAGALVCWWRRGEPRRIAGGMLAGAAALVAEAVAIVCHQFIAFGFSDSGGGESVFEAPVFLIVIGLAGSLLGLAGAAAASGLGRLVDRHRQSGRSARVPVE